MMPRPLPRGFTLIEILVVIIVVGLLAALAVVNLGGSGQSREMEKEIRELYLLMQTASEQAILNNEEIGLRVLEDGYQFVVFDEQSREWTEQVQRLFRPRSLPEWLVVTPLIEDGLPTLAGEEDKLEPDMVFFSSGEVTPFELEFTAGSDRDRMHRLTSDGVNGIEWQSPGDEDES